MAHTEKMPDDIIIQNQFAELKNEVELKKHSNKKKGSQKLKFSSEKKTFTDPKKPDPNSKYKFSITQVNTMAIVSFLLIPVFILGFFIPGSLGLAVLLTALIAGVGLALFSLAIGYKRRGVWAPGIASGFWLVILINLSLILFIL